MNLSAIVTMIIVFVVFGGGLIYCFTKIERKPEENYGSYSGDENEKNN